MTIKSRAVGREELIPMQIGILYSLIDLGELFPFLDNWKITFQGYATFCNISKNINNFVNLKDKLRICP